MRSIFWRWSAALVLPLLCGLSPLAAQNSDFGDLHPNAKGGIVQPAATAPPSDASDKTEKKDAPTLAYAAAVLIAVVVMCIICVPTRKSESMTSR